MHRPGRPIIIVVDAYRGYCKLSDRRPLPVKPDLLRARIFGFTFYPDDMQKIGELKNTEYSRIVNLENKNYALSTSSLLTKNIDFLL